MQIISSKDDRQRKALSNILDNKYGKYEQKVNPIVLGCESELFRQYSSRLVCPKCESMMAFVGRGRGYCPKCHYEGEGPTMTQYLMKKQYK